MTRSSTEESKHGGPRIGAGRKKTGRRVGGPHRRRPALSARHPVHVVLRLDRGLGRLRRGATYRVLRLVLGRFLGRTDFRVVHISIQDSHIHMIVEAASARALSRGMQGFTICAARALNRGIGRFGKVFLYRYHATQITTARYARNALAYVLNNWRRHREDFEHAAASAAKLDPYSSALSFTGWTCRFAPPPADYIALPVSPPVTSLLRAEWRRYGRIHPDECPGPLR
jgi:hypothetical protein